MIRAVADTHALIWYLTGDPRLSAPARVFIDTALSQGEQIALSVITLIEMIYLTEKKRIPRPILERAVALFTESPGAFAVMPVDLGIAQTLLLPETQSIPDMPDRIIAATAVYLDVPLVSRDRKIELSPIQTIW